MSASTVDLSSLHLVIPTTGPQFYAHADGTPIVLRVTTNDNPVDDLDPNDVRVVQGQSGPATLVLPDGSAPNLDAAVLTPYSLVTPPGVIVVG